MGIEVIHEQGKRRKHDSRIEQGLPELAEDSIAEAEAECQARLPRQEIHTLRCAALAMAAQLDEKQQEAPAGDAQAQSKQHGSHR